MIKAGMALFFKLSVALECYGELSSSHDEILSLGGQGGREELLGREGEEPQRL